MLEHEQHSLGTNNTVDAMVLIYTKLSRDAWFMGVPVNSEACSKSA